MYFVHRYGIAPIYAVASDLLEAEDAGVPFDRCVEVGNGKLDGEVDDDVDVYLGLRGDVRVDARAAEDEEAEVDELIDLRKTRAGGNWLMGGILDDDFGVVVDEVSVCWSSA
jgi:hypothetical protein